MTILSAAVLLFVVMDPIGNVPLFVFALREVAPDRRRKVVLRELAIALAVLIGFLFVGRHVLALFGVSGPSLSIAGGLILFLIALRLIFRDDDGAAAEQPDGEPLVFPLAIPYVAGPSAMATVILLATREPDRLLDWMVALAGAWLASASILLFAADLARLVGRRGLSAMERLMGLILTAVAVEMTLSGVAEFLAARGIG